MQLLWKTYGWSKYIRAHLKIHIAKSCPSALKEASPPREGTDIRKQVLVKQHNKARNKGISSPSVFNEEDQKVSRRDLA